MVATATGFVLGAIVGAIATAAGSATLYWKRERDATRRLRRALAEEVRTYEYVDDLVGDGNYELVTERVEDPVVYAAAAGELGRLDTAEIDALVGFYGDVRWLRGLQDPEDKKGRIEAVVEKRQRALEALGVGESKSTA